MKVCVDPQISYILWKLHFKTFPIIILLSSVQSLSHVRLFVISWTTAHHASQSIPNSQSLFKLMSIESVMPSNHLILCHPLLLLPSIFPAPGSFPMSVFCNLAARVLEFSFSISFSSEYSGLIFFRIGWFDLLIV